MPQQPARSLSDRGFALTRSFEGLRLAAYQDSAGIWTIGYGHTGADVHPGRKITHDEADRLLRTDMQIAVDVINRLIDHPLTQTQFDALVDLCYNIGQGNFRHSGVLAACNVGNLAAAEKAFLDWTKAGGREIGGLVRRRQAEIALFHTESAAAAA